MRYYITKISKLTFLVSVCTISLGAIEQPLESNPQIMRFVRLVQKRYYLVHRLEKPIEFLTKLSHGNITFPSGISDQFQHPHVIKYMKALELDHDVRAINNLWSDFLSYKYIEEDLFVRETIIAIVIVYRALIVGLKNDSEHKNMATYSYWVRPWDFNGQELYENFHSLLHVLDESYNEENFIITNNLRHYHIQRLFKSIALLTKINTQYLHPLWDCLVHTIQNNAISFKHKTVQECLSSILQTQSLEPLFSLWRDFMAYKFANDTLFLQEFVTLEYMLYRKLIDCLHFENLRASPAAEDLIDLYASIATLPVPQMLNSLDMLVEELIVIMEKYELNAAMSWTEWFKKYWWVPPIVISSVIINFVLARRNSAEIIR